MLSSQLKDYIKIYHNVLDQSLCESAVESLKSDIWQEHYYFNAASQQREVRPDDVEMSWDNIAQRAEIQDLLHPVIYRYVIEDIASEVFGGWSGYSPIRFNKYKENKKMKYHCDHIQDLFGPGPNGIPILSIVGGLNNDYEGGEFVMWDEVIEIPAGSVLIFPSSFMFPHKVQPVTSGVRYSYVSWVF